MSTTRYWKDAVCLVTDDMRDISIVSKEGTREPTKLEVVRALYIMLRYPSKGKGLFKKRLTSAWTKFWAAPWKASQASWLQETLTTPEPPLSSSDT